MEPFYNYVIYLKKKVFSARETGAEEGIFSYKL